MQLLKGIFTYGLVILGLSFGSMTVLASPQESFITFKENAEQGDPEFQYLTGIFYHRGYGVRLDYEKALYWFKKASAQDHAGAQNSLGSMYLFGEGVLRDRDEAKEWFGQSCDNGHQNSCDSYKNLHKIDMLFPD